MDFETAAEISNLLDRITDPTTDFFDAADARKLIEIVPLQTPKTPFMFSYKGPKKTNNITGHATNAGNIDYGHDERTEIQIGGIKPRFIGEYQFFHTPGELEVHKMWADTKIDKTGQKLRLIYNARTKEPTALKLYKQDPPKLWQIIPAIGNFGGLTFDSSFSGYVNWKTPNPNS